MFASFKTMKFSKKDFILVIVMMVLCVGALLQWWICPLTRELGREIESPYYATMDAEGNRYIINNGKSEILKINAENGRIETRISCDDHEDYTFGEANQVAVDEQGNIYVMNLFWKDTGLGIATENILQYDAKGHLVKVIYEQDYTESMVMKRHLFSLISQEKGITFAAVSSDADLIKWYSYSAVEDDLKTVQEISNVEQVENIQDISIDHDGILFYVTKKGEIFQTDGKEKTEVYHIPDGEFILPYSITNDEEGNLYFTDICNQELYRVAQGKAEKYYDTAQLADMTGIDISKAILLTVQNNNVKGNEYLSVTCNDGVFYIDQSQGQADVIEKIPYAVKFQAALIARWTALIIVGILALYYVAVLMRIVFTSGIIKRKSTIIILIAGVVISALVVMSSLFARFKNEYISEQIASMCTVTQIAANMIHTEDLEKSTYPSDYGSEAYQALQDDMSKIIDVSSIYSENLYCNLVKIVDDRCYALGYLDNSIGAYYPLDEREAEEARQVYDTGELFINDGKADVTGSYVYVKYPILDKDGTVAGIVEVGMVSDTLTYMVNDMRNKMIVKIALMIVIAVFVLNEIFAFIDDQKEWKVNKRKHALPISYLRVITFFCFAAYNMPTSFLPVYIEKFYSENLPISIELAGSLPLTVNFAMIGIMSLFCAGFLRKLGFRLTMMMGSMICLAGDVCMALAGNYFIVAAGLLLNGIGCGLVMNGLVIIVANQGQEDQTKGFSVINGAILSGMITGTVVGAGLAELLGDSHMFLFSAGIWVLLSVGIFVIGKSFTMREEQEKKEKKEKKKGIASVFSGQMLGYLLLIVVPYTIVNGFTSYFLPVFADANGLTQSQTSLFLVMNCLVGIFLSGTLTDVVMKYMGRWSIYLSSILSLGSVILFGYFQNMYMLAFSLFLLGAAKSFGSTSREIVFCDQPAVQDYGEDKAMGYYNLADNIGESLGTMVFGGIVTVGFIFGAWILSAVSVGMLGIYEMTAGKKHKN